MKKSQRLRFYALVSKQSQGTALDAAESAEFRTLAALVATHPNASEDTDDTTTTETDEEKKKREEKEAADKKAADDKKKEDDEAAAKAKGLKPGVSARLSAAMAALKPGSAAGVVTAELQQARKDLATAQGDLATTKATLKSTETSLNALCDFLGLKPADVAGKSQADIDGICTAKINAAAIEQVASLGLNPATLPAPSGAAAATDKSELHRQYNAITDPNERARFYAKHEKQLLG